MSRCWDWSGYTTPGGYGYVGFDGRHEYVHRAVYEELVGPIPEGLHIDHLCQNKACYNPSHLEPVLPKENVRRYFGPLTHCRNGHEYSGENTYRYRGRRYCRTCRREHQRAARNFMRSES